MSPSRGVIVLPPPGARCCRASIVGKLVANPSQPGSPASIVAVSRAGVGGREGIRSEALVVEVAVQVAGARCAGARGSRSRCPLSIRW